MEFIGRDGKRQALDVARYSAPPTYHPASTGPAFDCKLAATAIEKTICGDSGLSAQDLALSELYNRIRLGSAACLKVQYTAQYDKLNQWVPTRPKP